MTPRITHRKQSINKIRLKITNALHQKVYGPSIFSSDWNAFDNI